MLIQRDIQKFRFRSSGSGFS